MNGSRPNTPRSQYKTDSHPEYIHLAFSLSVLSELGDTQTIGKAEFGGLMGDRNELQLKIKKVAILVFVIVIVAGFSPLSSYAVSPDFLSDANFLQYKEEKRAPDFQLKDPEDNPTRLDAFQGKIVLLYFWTTW